MELPYYNFKKGEREYKGDFLKLGKEDILVIEGIHCLNDRLSYSLPRESKFKIYISALTPVSYTHLITADDFVEDLYHQVAAMVFEGHEAGNVNPAGILSRFINDEDQYKEVASLFNASLKESLNNEEQKKAFAETVMKEMCIRDRYM